MITPGAVRQQNEGLSTKSSCDESFYLPERQNVDVVELDHALTRLSRRDAQQEKIVELRFFGGLTVEETAVALEISPGNREARLEHGQGVAHARSGEKPSVEKTGQWERVKELFDAALERNPQDRAEFPERGLRLRHLAPRGIGVAALCLRAVRRPLPARNSRERPRKKRKPLESIGPYRLIRKIGEGGMGQVWLAEQSEPMRRQVALKLIRAGVFDDSLLRRFQAERQSLALMEHPAIAKVFDAGATAEGQPYFVMEYVPGEPITNYCDHKKLSIPERLELFVKVCEGVQHAHQKAIIHRDLKPANILVVEVDGKPAPRIIDFGLAKAAAPLAAGESIFTGSLGHRRHARIHQPGTGCRRVDIDTRTDVYCAWRRSVRAAYRIASLRQREVAQAAARSKCCASCANRIRRAPAHALTTERNLSATSAPLRSTEPKATARACSTAISTRITMKALEKDRVAPIRNALRARRRHRAPSEP